MLYRHHIDFCASFPESERASLFTRLAPCLHTLQTRGDLMAGALQDLAMRTHDLEIIQRLSERIRTRFKSVVVVGAGGASLSGHVLTQLKPQPWPISLHYLDNIDPDAFHDCVAQLNLADTFFLIISKSGGTVETLSQFYVLYDMMRAIKGDDAHEHFLVITTHSPSPLYDSALEQNIRMLDYDAHIGGRFSALTVVGLLPAALCGLDIAAIRRGAAQVVLALDNCRTMAQCAPAIGAITQYYYCMRGHNMNVFLPYASRLSGLSSWYRQCWSESLGKNGHGSTPIRAVGSTDQHSQLQLYLDGPRDKLFHFIRLKHAGRGPVIGAPVRDDLTYIRGKKMGDVMEAEQRATLETLVEHGCPVRVFELDVLAEAQLGALLMHFTFEIIFMAHLWDVNPFDQPAVEKGKVLARDYLLSGSL